MKVNIVILFDTEKSNFEYKKIRLCFCLILYQRYFCSFNIIISINILISVHYAIIFFHLSLFIIWCQGYLLRWSIIVNRKCYTNLLKTLPTYKNKHKQKGSSFVNCQYIFFINKNCPNIFNEIYITSPWEWSDIFLMLPLSRCYFCCMVLYFLLKHVLNPLVNPLFYYVLNYVPI